MGSIRLCSRSACQEPAIATLTYVYAESTAVLGPLATFAEPHCYDLCVTHANRMTVPRGWNVMRLQIPDAPRLAPDELSALADAVSETPSSATADGGDHDGPTQNDQPQRSREPLTPPADSGIDGVPHPGDRPNLRMLREPNE
ncbi:DUF3499 domain-containing protein [Zhihengliuella sp.]|uniref:DUF3499 domain-containing protein n=1 Tax=Zhihengliuella sp. TaxID=1954483 RepID=UPI0028115CEA|nr:DUF3499 domain-containing protein [Zhihengliuella sp.]